MGFKSIQTKMLLYLLPIIILALGALAGIAAMTAQDMINQQVEATMKASAERESAKVSVQMQKVKTTATNIAMFVANTYKTTSWDVYQSVLTQVLESNDMLIGSGLWFEPYIMQGQEYYGPYLSHEGGKITLTMEYSNASYDYFHQEYYLNAKNSKEAKFTDPYYDDASKTIMSSCSMPMLDKGTFVGCITTPIHLKGIQEMVESVKVGEGGTAFLVGRGGAFAAGVPDELIKNKVSVTDTGNPSFDEAGKAIMGSESGLTSYVDKDGTEYLLQYNTIPETGWRMVIKMPKDEITAPVNAMLLKLGVVTVFALIVVSLVVLFVVRNIVGSVVRVKNFSDTLAKGDFTVQPLQVNSADELGTMSQSLNKMYSENKQVISGIAVQAKEISAASLSLKDASEHLSQQFEQISHSMVTVNEAMMSASAATEEVNASAEEINASVQMLLGKTNDGLDRAQEIRGRAKEIETASQDAYRVASELSSEFQEKLALSIKNAEVVQNISKMADAIANVANQINLLSLNASIEAARAGEAGRGFAVVATEIGKLANETSDTVSEIQKTITQVQEAFRGITDNAEAALGFINETVSPDYRRFIDVAKQYNDDADVFSDISSQISDMAENIHETMSEVGKAIENIANSAQDTAEASNGVAQSVDAASDRIAGVVQMSDNQQAISNDLDQVVSKFKLK